MELSRREFLKRTAGLTGLCSLPPTWCHAADESEAYPYLGRTEDYRELQLIDPGLSISKVESWTLGNYGIVRITTDDGREGYGQLSSYDPEISAIALHRKVAPHVLGRDPAHIDRLVDQVIDANMKYPWSFICRALSGIDTAIWDLFGKIRDKPVCELIGGKPDPFSVYGSSMRRNISPEDEAARLVRLRDSHGYKAFKVRVGVPTGHNRDASPGRSEKLIPTVRKAVGDDVQLLADGNSCYTPPKAIALGRQMEEQQYFWFEEPCPYWELEWTAAVTDALKMNVAGGEQDNDLAQWRRMIHMNVVDILQPDICYVGGFTRAWRVAQMARGANKLVVPHSSHLSLITVFSLHLMAAIPNAGPFVEYSIEPDINAGEAIYSPGLTVQDGRAIFSEQPGWGVTINPAWLEKADYEKTD